MLSSGGWLITLYGSDTDTSGNFPLITTVQALSSLTSVSLRISDAGNTIENEGEVKEFCNKSLQEYSLLRSNYALKVLPTRVQSTSLQSILPIEFLKNKFKWIDWGNYPIKDVNCGTNQVEAIVVTGDYGLTFEDGWMTYTIPCKSRGIL